ncbi:hypothetical protein AAVH_41538 [Aphelenchoides avenae]|nr:hypothetical protein AAVH_41538 [Aphelenchus avenae]
MEMRSRCINRLEEDKAIMATFQAAATREIAKPDIELIKVSPLGTHRAWKEETVMQKKRTTTLGQDCFATEYKLTKRYSMRVERLQAGCCEGVLFYIAIIAVSLACVAVAVLILLYFVD